jgi:hypothetical protein
LPVVVPVTIHTVAVLLHWLLVPGPAFIQQDTPMGAIIIVTPRDTFIGEVMTTGITLIDLMSVRCTTTGTSTTNGNSITVAIGGTAINFVKPFICERFSGRFHKIRPHLKGFFITYSPGSSACFEQFVLWRTVNQLIFHFYHTRLEHALAKE